MKTQCVILLVLSLGCITTAEDSASSSRSKVFFVMDNTQIKYGVNHLPGIEKPKLADFLNFVSKVELLPVVQVESFEPLFYNDVQQFSTEKSIEPLFYSDIIPSTDKPLETLFYDDINSSTDKPLLDTLFYEDISSSTDKPLLDTLFFDDIDSSTDKSLLGILFYDDLNPSTADVKSTEPLYYKDVHLYARGQGPYGYVYGNAPLGNGLQKDDDQLPTSDFTENSQTISNSQDVKGSKRFVMSS